MAEKKEKQYVSDNARLMAEWDWKKNNELGLDPKILTLGSGKKVWWKCQKEHEWQATVASRNAGNGCPYCSGRYAVKGENDLQTVNPTLAKEWVYEKNKGKTPLDVLPNSNMRAWWKCEKGHEWQAMIADRNYGYGCPYCAGRYAVKGENDLQTVNPTLAKEWNYEKNENLNPTDVLPHSGKKVWWKCHKAHEWQATICDRNNGKGCPYCAGQKVLKGENDLQTVNPTLAKEWNYEKNKGLKPTDVMPNTERKVWWKCEKGHEWQATIGSRNSGSRCPICSSERKTSFPEYAIEYYLKKHCLEVKHSYRENGYELDIYIPLKKIAIEYDGYFWHKNKTKKDLEKNQKCVKDGIQLYRIREELPPLNDTSIDYIIQKNQKDLPETLNKILSEILGENVDVNLERDTIAIENLREYREKENSVLLSNPILAKEWNYEKNDNLKPEHFTVNSSKKVWWICDNGHEWQAKIANRNHGYGCPYCTGQKVVIGYNDLQTVNSKIANEWNGTKNGELTPRDVLPYSHRKVWWVCQNGHEWQATIADRSHGYGCPYCSGRRAIKGENDLQTVNPTLAKEWNHEKNKNLQPTDVLPNSGKSVWWRCSRGHEWQARIQSRNRGCGCPQCKKRKKKK